MERVSALPGVQYAAFAWGVPLTGNNWPRTVEIEGQPAASKESDQISLPLRAVTPDTSSCWAWPFPMGGISVPRDTRKAPDVAVINQALADRYFPKPIRSGRSCGSTGGRSRPTEIVGVVTNGRTDDLTQAAEPEVYLSLWQASAFSKHLVIPNGGGPARHDGRRPTRTALRRSDRSRRKRKTLEQIRGDSLASRTFAMQLLVGFSLWGAC